VETGRLEPGEVVYLVSEVFAAGRIFEIGARALVLEDDAGELSIELGGNTVSCRAEQVATRRPRASRAAAWPRRPAGAPRPALL